MLKANSDSQLLDSFSIHGAPLVEWEGKTPNDGKASSQIPGDLLDEQEPQRVRVALCETQPIAVAGIQAILNSSADLQLSWASESLMTALHLVRTTPPDVLVLDKAFGFQVVLDALADLRSANVQTQVVVWGIALTEAEALRFLQAGARGVVRKTADLNSLLSCLRKVATGGNWMEDYVIQEAARGMPHARYDLTPREQQVLELVERGLKNKEIALELNIRPGTVKIHLKHIFEKTGVRGRYGLALASLKDRGVTTGRGVA